MTFRRVLRGGSWINNQDNARASIRNNNEPDNRNNNLGFRLSCSSHIAPVLPHCRYCLPITICRPRRRTD
ncbi:MAG: SUMF1/EgtB/PvdO family nonheme iron enzyme [gamma proteobacterium endosymbiont of Lamellibrachia anaximandri]|nr:SUMF1/EgtB/PvdO family nonheme iron enzyme [gamma proteobacterium endosymbiont of Lamellibrachia anaximandri]MBL3533479.1 SUMF1/EgtB/PvdO family nonheme iron enzyme [gamma proteobacterium endosymbiont of Lamellibrachia anaximandri]MBL3599769.1 SUMF1/EgtB/PvdO family nonheme iron enzyme [gamma proteobacterium endosymbiont of Lamellibrachia anaximandri]